MSLNLGRIEDGQIGYPHYSNSQIYLDGKENVATSEFDSQLVVHEWGHHFIHTLSRSDDRLVVNRDHGWGTVEDPRLVWNESWATAVAAMILYPDPVYRDTFGPQQGPGFEFDSENESNGPFDECPRWMSENGVGHILYDLFDPSSAGEPFDTVSLSLGEIYDLMAGPERTTPAFTTIFSFLDALKTGRPDLVTGVDAISAHHGVAPVADAWGTGETNDGPGTCTGGPPSSPGVEGLLPVYHLLGIDQAPVPILLTVDESRYLIDNARFAAFTGDGSKLTLTADAGGSTLVVHLFERGVLQGTAVRRSDGRYSLAGFVAENGKTYTVAVSGPATGPYDTAVTLELKRT